MARVSKMTPAAAPSSRTKKTSSAAAAPSSRTKKTSSAAAAPSSQTKKTSSAAAAPSSRTKKTSSAAAAPSSRTKKTSSAAAAPSSRSGKKAAPAQPASPPHPAKQTVPSAARLKPAKQTIPVIAPLQPAKHTIPVAAPLQPAKQTVPVADISYPAKKAIPATAEVIEIPASPTRSVTSKKGKKDGKWKGASPPVTLELDEIEMWTPRQKCRIDEECCILSSDPLAAAEVLAAPAAGNDDIEVIAERGKVACRDYPHPRYACAKYPFATTPHERHCEQCFCYVCDIAAPCVTWIGKGHCHASNKDKVWQVTRGVAKRKQ